MEAALLMADVVGITLVLLWVGRGGGGGLFAWRLEPPPDLPSGLPSRPPWPPG